MKVTQILSTIGQCGRSAGTYRDLGDLKQRGLRNLNLGDLKKGPKGAYVPPHKKKTQILNGKDAYKLPPN
jgi:predicted transcriptional regulator